MTTTIGKRWTFDAAHHLPDLPDGHKCGRVHGHTYTVELALATDADNDLTAPGFVVDFGDLAPFGTYLATRLDHQNLNDRLPMPPTSELLARHLYAWAAIHLPLPVGVRVVSVRVSETPSTWAEYQPPRPGGSP